MSASLAGTEEDCAMTDVMTRKPDTKPAQFRLEEATIDDLHRAIRAGETTVLAVVQQYLARVRAYNGVASMLVTSDGAPVAEAKGAVRAGAPLKVPTQTVKASTFLPDLDHGLVAQSQREDAQERPAVVGPGQQLRGGPVSEQHRSGDPAAERI